MYNYISVILIYINLHVQIPIFISVLLKVSVLYPGSANRSQYKLRLHYIT